MKLEDFPTPLTDAVAYDLESISSNPPGLSQTDDPSGFYVDSSFARDLERRLSAARFYLEQIVHRDDLTRRGQCDLAMEALELIKP